LETVDKIEFFGAKLEESKTLLGADYLKLELVPVETGDILHPLAPSGAAAAIFQLPWLSSTYVLRVYKTFMWESSLHMLTHVATHETCHAYLASVGPHNTERNAEKCVWQARGDKFYVATYWEMMKDDPQFADMDYTTFRSIVVGALLGFNKLEVESEGRKDKK
jgi:hypothetical protein